MEDQPKPNGHDAHPIEVELTPNQILLNIGANEVMDALRQQQAVTLNVDVGAMQCELILKSMWLEILTDVLVKKGIIDEDEFTGILGYTFKVKAKMIHDTPIIQKAAGEVPRMRPNSGPRRR